MSFDQFATLAQAAIAGMGAALLPGFLIEDELAAAGSFLALPMKSAEPYHPVWPHERAKHPRC